MRYGYAVISLKIDSLNCSRASDVFSSLDDLYNQQASILENKPQVMHYEYLGID